MLCYGGEQPKFFQTSSVELWQFCCPLSCKDIESLISESRLRIDSTLLCKEHGCTFKVGFVVTLPHKMANQPL